MPPRDGPPGDPVSTNIFVHPPPGVEPADLPAEGAVALRVPNWLGDAVMALPAVSAVAERYRERSVIVLARPGVAPIYAGLRGVAEIHRVGRSAMRLAAARRALAGGPVALGIVLPHSMGSAMELAVAPCGELWGYGGPLRRLALDRALPRRWIGGRHRWEEYALLVAAATGAPVEERYPLVSAPGDVAAADALWAEAGIEAGEPVVGFVPGSNASSRRWPAERFAALAGRLGRLGARVAVFGSDGERPLTGAIAAGADPPAVDWGGRVPIPVLFECFRRLAFVVTNDTGPMHMAAAVGTPLLALVGASDMRLTAPRGPGAEVLIHPVPCRPCMDNTCPYNLECMRGISVDGAFERVRLALESAA